MMMAKILQVGAHEELMLNYYRHFQSGNVLFDYVLRKGGIDFRFKNDPKFDGKLHYLTSMQASPINYIKELREVVRSGSYTHVHLHAGWANIYGLIACIGLSVVTISHNHNFYTASSLVKKFIRLFLKIAINGLTDYKFACSADAGKQMFYGKWRVLKNAIDYEKFIFNQLKRVELRGALNIAETCIVLGHVGNFINQKNQMFLIQIFHAFKCLMPTAKLVMVGADYGDLDQVKQEVSKLKLESDVVFLGDRSDVGDVLCAFDVFVFPSHYEGFGIALLEAQVSGLPCLYSSCIPRDAVIANTALPCQLVAGAEVWARRILDLVHLGADDSSRIARIGKLPHTFNVAEVASELEIFYLSSRINT
jgi:glycosyltransferase involved in cell wall biosynthesis